MQQQQQLLKKPCQNSREALASQYLTHLYNICKKLNINVYLHILTIINNYLIRLFIFLKLKMTKSYSKKYKSTRPFRCNMCKEKFMFSRGLHFHNTIHTNPLICKYPNCGKKFSRVCSYQLKLHENKHKLLLVSDKTNRKRKIKNNKYDELDELDELIELVEKEIKKIKIDKTLFTAKVVSGIKMPNLPRGFKPLPEYGTEYETDNESDDGEYCSRNKEMYSYFENLTLLANVCSSI